MNLLLKYKCLTTKIHAIASGKIRKYALVVFLFVMVSLRDNIETKIQKEK